MRSLLVSLATLICACAGAQSSILPSAYSLLPAQDIDRLFEQHSRRTTSAVSVEVRVDTGELSTRFNYDLYYRAPDRFRLDFRPAAQPPFVARKYTIIGDGQFVTGYEAATNRYARRRYSPDMGLYSNATQLLQQGEPFMAAYLEPGTGLQEFLKQFGELKFEVVSAEGALMWAAPIRAESGNASLVVMADPLSMEIRSVRFEAEGGVGASWTVRRLPLDLDSALSFRPPSDARVASNLFDPINPATAADETTEEIVARSRKAYSELRSVVYSSQAFLFSQRDDQRRLANGWWERDGNFRYAVTIDKPEKSFAALFDGKALTAWNRVANSANRGEIQRTAVFRRLERLGAEFEPLIQALIRGDNFWDQIATSGAHLRALEEPVSVRGFAGRAVEARLGGGWIAVLYVRDADGLIARADRRLEMDGRVMYTESVFYDYHIVNAPVPANSWDLQMPRTVKILPLDSSSGR